MEILYKIFGTIEMGGNYMVEKYLMKLNSQNLSIFAKMCWNGQGTTILYMRQYTWKHVKIVKSSIVSIGLNGNKFMNITNVYSPKQNQYTSHGN